MSARRLRGRGNEEPILSTSISEKSHVLDFMKKRKNARASVSLCEALSTL
jgi:hypothetical protein